jgi:uncharacterized protein (DUF4213/DUF364 family)
MGLKDEFRKMVMELTKTFTIPPVEKVFLPPFYKGGQPKDVEFMAIRLVGGATGISFVLLPDEKGEEYTALQPHDFVGKDPGRLALEFGSDNPVKEMISLAAINAICQHVMEEADFAVDSATDSLGLLSVSPEDRIGMVGFFSPLIKTIENVGAELIIIEKDHTLIEEFPDLSITLDPTGLNGCSKILCTSTTILNNSLDEILTHRPSNAMVSIIGPTAGYFPDPLFARGIDVVGGRVVKDGTLFMQRLEERKRWGDVTRKTCFQRETYTGIY